MTVSDRILYAGLDMVCKQDPLQYGYAYVDLLEGRKWEHRPWQEEIYKAVNPQSILENPDLPRKMVVMKPTQVGLSTMGLVKNFHFADYWNVRTIYTLPRQQDVTDMVMTRVEPMIKASPRLNGLLGKPDSSRAKRLGDSYLFYMELSVEPRMMPADAVYIDEVDLSNPTYMETAINRMDSSAWQLLYYFSTPTLSNYGIHALYELSDKREWFVKCSHCNHWQIMDWEHNLAVKGDERDPDEVMYVCAKCREELAEDIPLGRWVAAQPKKSKDSTGFHVSQMMTHSATWLYDKFIDPRTTMVEFYRKRLGKPFEYGSGSLTRDDFLQYAFPRDGDYFLLETSAEKNASYYMGVDQGNNLQALVFKKRPGEDVGRIVWLENVDFDTGFDRLGKLMYRFGVTRCVIDGDPNRHKAAEFAKDFEGRVYIADYNHRVSGNWKLGNDSKGVRNRVAIQRTHMFDALMTSIVNSNWLLAGQPPANIDQRVERLISHVTALRRDVSQEKTLEGTEQVVTYRAIGPDHFAQAWLYAMVAEELVTGKSFRVRKIGEGDLTEKENLGKIDKNKMRRVIRIR